MSTSTVGSLVLSYDDLGSGHPLVLIAGLGAPRQHWWKQLEPFSTRFRVINPDNRDAGETGSATAPYAVADMADDVAGLIEKLNLGRAHVVGVSMGGMIAQELAIRHPHLLDRLILVATAAGGPSTANPEPEVAALLMQTEGDPETRLRRTLTGIAADGYMREHPEDLDQLLKTAFRKPMSPEAYQRQLGACMAHLQNGTAGRLSQIKAQTLVIHGDSDPLIPCANGVFLAEHIDGARLSSFGGVGHIVMVESPERFNREVTEFLGRGK